MKLVMTNSKTLTANEKFIEMYKADPDLNKKEAAELLGLSRTQIYRLIDAFEKDMCNKSVTSVKNVTLKNGQMLHKTIDNQY